MEIERIRRSELGKLLRNGSFWKLLYLSFLSYFSLALFEGTFALHAQQVMKFGPAQMGMVFIVYGIVMAVDQGAIVGWFIDYKKEILLLAIGSGMVGVALILLLPPLCWQPQSFWRQKFFWKEGDKMVRILTEESLHSKIVWRKEGAQQAFFPYNDPGQLPITPLRHTNGEWMRESMAKRGRSGLMEEL